MKCPCHGNEMPCEFVGECLGCGGPFDNCDAWYLVNDKGEWWHEGCRRRHVLELRFGPTPH